MSKTREEGNNKRGEEKQKREKEKKKKKRIKVEIEKERALRRDKEAKKER